MNDFKQIMIKKAKLIGELKYPHRSNREAILKYLKIIKQQQKQTEQLDRDVLLKLAQLKYQHKKDLQKIYFLSFTVMKSFCKKFQFIPVDEDIFANIVQMYSRFYARQEMFEKVQEIKQLYRNKNDDKSNLLNQLLVWIYSWGKKKFDKFLNQNISLIEKDFIIDKLESTSKLKQKMYKQTQTSSTELSLQSAVKKISYSKRLAINEKNQNFKIVINNNSNIISESNQNQLNNFDQSDKMLVQDLFLLKEQSTRIETSFQPERIDELIPKNNYLKNRSRSFNRDYIQKPVGLQINLNKQIFYGTYWKQINQIYKSVGCIGDLDFYYLKTFKKQKEERKEQFKANKIDQLVQSAIKSMPIIKKSIQNYDKDYEKNCPNHIKQFHLEQSTYLEQENQQKKGKEAGLRKISELKAQQKSKKYQKIKSEQNIINKNECYSQEIKIKKIVSNISENKKSVQTSIRSKSMHEKVQIQTKQRMSNNPQHFYKILDLSTQKTAAIHQKYDKILLNGIRPYKGQIRYKNINKQKQKKNLDQKEFVWDNKSELIGSIREFKKEPDYQIANIRKILKNREKQRQLLNKTSAVQQNKQIENMQKFMLHIKGTEAQQEIQRNEQGKADKFAVFISNFKKPIVLPFHSKLNNIQFILNSNKSRQIQNPSLLKQVKTDFFPKIS